MNGMIFRKKRDMFERVFDRAFIAAFSFAIVCVAAAAFSMLGAVRTLAVFMAGTALCAALIFLYVRLDRRMSRLSERDIDKRFYLLALIVLGVQFGFAYLLYSEPINDLSYVDGAARSFCLTWDKQSLNAALPASHADYFARYPNNQALLVILSVLYSLSYKLFGSALSCIPVTVNTLGLNISFIMLYKAAKIVLKKPSHAFYTSFVAALFPCFYTYAPFYYTDSMSMPFAMGSLLCFLKAYYPAENGGSVRKNAVKNAALLGLSCLLAAVGYKIKGSVIVLIPAYILFLLLRGLKAELKRIVAVTAASAACVIILGGALGAFDIADSEDYDNYKFPLAHWVMMGLDGNGGYDGDDYRYTLNSGSYDEKVSADVGGIIERLKSYGVSGTIVHMGRKLAHTWSDGTYFIRRYVKNGSGNALRTFVSESAGFLAYCSAYQFMLLIMILSSFIFGATSKRRRVPDSERSAEALELIKIVFAAVFVFFLIWECRSRYLVNFSPLFILLSSYSISCFGRLVQERNVFIFRLPERCVRTDIVSDVSERFEDISFSG